MKVIVTGGRTFTDAEMVDRSLRKLSPTLIIEGGAEGLDTLAREWAEKNGVEYHTEEPDYDKYTTGIAPKIRNSRMLAKFPDATVLVFPGNKGTADCWNKAIKLKRNIVKAE